MDRNSVTKMLALLINLSLDNLPNRSHLKSFPRLVIIWTLGILDNFNFTCLSMSNRKNRKKHTHIHTHTHTHTHTQNKLKWVRLLFPEKDMLTLHWPSYNLHAASQHGIKICKCDNQVISTTIIKNI